MAPLSPPISWLPAHVKTPRRNIWGRDLGIPDLCKRSSFTGTLMNTSVKAHKDMLDVPIYYRSRNINRASISELKPIANFLKRISQQLIAEQNKLWAREDFPIVKTSSRFCLYLLNNHHCTYTFSHADTEAHTHKHT